MRRLQEAKSKEPTLILMPVLAKVTAPVSSRIDNILTMIRLIRGVATVTQIEAIKKPDLMHRSIEILVKCHNGELSRDDFISALRQDILQITNVRIVTANFISDSELAFVLNKKQQVTSRQSAGPGHHE